MTYYQLIQNALNAYVNCDKFAYFYGAKGQILTDEVMHSLVSCEPTYFSQYSQQDMERIFNYSRGKTGFDCSGFITFVSGVQGYSTSLYTTSQNKTSPHNGTEGNILYTTFNNTGRHIGLDIGYGYFVHMRKELNSVELGKISGYGWEHSGQLLGIDYTGAKS